MVDNLYDYMYLSKEHQVLKSEVTFFETTYNVPEYLLKNCENLSTQLGRQLLRLRKTKEQSESCEE